MKVGTAGLGVGCLVPFVPLARDPTTMNALLFPLMANAIRDGARLRYALLDSCGPSIVAASKLLIDCLERGNKVLFFGNGGSAADAQHFAAELVGRFVLERRPLPGLALTVDTSALTSIGNDYGFEHVFSRQVLALGAPGDVAVAITTSGKSPNIVAALKASRERGIQIIGLTGKKGTAFAADCDVAVVVPATNTARIQECHLAVGHVLCEAIDVAMFAAPTPASPEAKPARARASRSPKELDLPTLLAMRARWKADGQTVVWTNGNFDLLHVGHLESLRAARALGDVLVVGVNADASVTRAKGPNRPIFPVAERVEMLAGLEVVDHLIVFDEPTPEAVLAEVRPDIHCKGADYAPPNGAPIPEAALVMSYGGRIEFLPLVPERSSSKTLARLMNGE